MVRAVCLCVWLLMVGVLTGCTGDQRQQSRAQTVPTATVAPPLIEVEANPLNMPPPTPTATPGPPPPPPVVHAVRHAPGVRFTPERGVYFIDPASGEVEGWEFTGATLYGFGISPSGRYLSYSVADPRPGGTVIAWMFDTRTGTQFQPASGLFGWFSPDERRLAAFGDGVLTVLRTEDWTEERRIPFPFRLGASIWQMSHWNGAGVTRGWSPAGNALLLTVWGPRPQQPTGSGAPVEDRVVRVDLERGMVHEVASGLFPFTAWSADGSRYFVRTWDALEARDSRDDRVLWRKTAVDLGIYAERKRGIEPLGGLGYPIPSPDGASVIVAGGLTLHVLDAVNGAQRFRVEGTFACGRTWTADSRWMALIGYRQHVPGSYLVSADGRDVRRSADYVHDVSPVHSGLAAQRLHGLDGGLRLLNAPDGTERRFIPISGQFSWDTNHDPLWLRDGRLAISSPHAGHGGCGFDVLSPPDLQIHFP